MRDPKNGLDADHLSCNILFRWAAQTMERAASGVVTEKGSESVIFSNFVTEPAPNRCGCRSEIWMAHQPFSQPAGGDER